MAFDTPVLCLERMQTSARLPGTMGPLDEVHRTCPLEPVLATVRREKTAPYLHRRNRTEAMTCFQHCHMFRAHLSCRQCPGDVPPQEGGLGRWQSHDTGSKGEGRGPRGREGDVSLNSVGHIAPLNTTSLADLVKLGGT